MTARRREVGPRAGSRRLAGAVGAVLSALVVVGCSPSGPAAPAPPDRDTTAEACSNVRGACAAVVVGGQSYRYQLTEGRPGDPDAGTVVVDLGGPGRALFGNDDAATVASRWPGPERLLFLEEPWVARAVPESCADSLRELYRDLRAQQDPSAELVGPCGLDTAGSWGWDPDRYRAVVDAVAAAEDLGLRGLVGSSYGAPRIAALADLPGLQWLVLNSPAPAAASAERYLQVRADTALQALTDACTDCPPEGGATRLLTAAQDDLQANPRTLPDRTPPVVAADVAAAAVGAAYLPTSEREHFVEGLRRLAPGDVSLIGRLSDSTLLRYGAEDVSPAMLAYYDEVCRDYGPWPTAPPSDGPLAALLTRLHAPCTGITPSATAPFTAPASTELRSCVATSEADAVTPAAFSRTWTDLLDSPLSVTVPGTTHAPLDAMLECVSRVRSP